MVSQEAVDVVESSPVLENNGVNSLEGKQIEQESLSENSTETKNQKGIEGNVNKEVNGKYEDNSKEEGNENDHLSEVNRQQLNNGENLSSVDKKSEVSEPRKETPSPSKQKLSKEVVSKSSKSTRRGIVGEEKKLMSKAEDALGLKEWKDVKFSVHSLEGHHHNICSADCTEDTIISGGYDFFFFYLLYLALSFKPFQ